MNRGQVEKLDLDLKKVREDVRDKLQAAVMDGRKGIRLTYKETCILFMEMSSRYPIDPPQHKDGE